MVGFEADGESGPGMSGRAGSGNVGGSGSFPSLLRESPAALALVLGLVSVLGLMLRLALDLDGALDVDTVAFGLSAWSFDPVHHQPQPPGYPGYVLLLKAIRAMAPWLDPLAVAKWGSRLCGAAMVPAAWWACREALRGSSADVRPASPEGPRPVPAVRPLFSALMVALHPLLWYGGADGQAHAAEGLVTLLLFGAAIRARRRPGMWAAAFLGAGFGLAGSVRLNIPLLALPILVWALWGRPRRAWGVSAIAGLLAVVAWWWPTVVLSGGWEAYSRAGRALLVEHIYRSGVAALACLVPALGPCSPRPGMALRAGLSLVAGPLIVLLGPATLRLSDAGAEVMVPSLAHVAEVERLLAFYRDRACGAAEGRPALVVTDHPNPLLMRLLPLECPGVITASYRLGGSVDPTLDDLHVFSRDGVRTLPTDVPLERGPPGTLTLSEPVDRVVLAPFASPVLRASVAAQATCPPLSAPAARDDQAAAVVFPSTCLASLRLGGNTLTIRGP